MKLLKKLGFIVGQYRYINIYRLFQMAGTPGNRTQLPAHTGTTVLKTATGTSLAIIPKIVFYFRLLNSNFPAFSAP